MFNPLKNRISIEIEGNIDVSEFEDFFEKLEKKLNILVPLSTYGYLEDNYNLNLDICPAHYYSRMLETNILDLDLSIKQNDLFIPSELLIQKYDLFDKQTFKIIKKACKIYDNFQTKVDPYEAIHVNLDARSFFPYLKELYTQNYELFNLNKNYRNPVKDQVIKYIKKGRKKSKRSSVALCSIPFDGRIELRIFNSDENGREKLIKFLKNSKKIVKEGIKNYDLYCYDKRDFIKYSLGIENPKMSNTTSTVEEIFKTPKEFLEKHEKGKSFEIDGFISMCYRDYDKFL